MLYQFNEYEWAELLQLTDFYRTLIPDFLWDALQNYFINHGNNKSIETRIELDMLIQVLETIACNKQKVKFEDIDEQAGAGKKVLCSEDYTATYNVLLNIINNIYIDIADDKREESRNEREYY